MSNAEERLSCQLARFGDFAQAAVPAIRAMLAKGHVLVGADYGGVDLQAGEPVPEWFRFTMDVARCRFGSAYSQGKHPRVFGLGPSLVESRLAPIGLSLNDITFPVKTAEVQERIASQGWLWGYSEEREERFPKRQEIADALEDEAQRIGAVPPGRIIDLSAVTSRFATVAEPYGFVSRPAAFGFTGLLHRTSSDGIDVYVGVKVHTDRKIPFPAGLSLAVMPDIDFCKLDPWFGVSHAQGWLFHDLSLLGTRGLYGSASSMKTFEVCLAAHETLLAAVLPVLVEVCDRQEETESCP